MDRIIQGGGALVRNVYVILLVFVLIAVVALIIVVKSTNATNTTVANNTNTLIGLATTNKQILTTVLDCTTPEGSCTKRNQAGTAEAVGGINALTMAAAVCADQPGIITALQMRDCVETSLKATAEAKP